MVTTPCVTSHIAHVRCQVSGVNCHLSFFGGKFKKKKIPIYLIYLWIVLWIFSLFFSLYFLSYKGVELVGEGSGIKWATLSSLLYFHLLPTEQQKKFKTIMKKYYFISNKPKTNLEVCPTQYFYTLDSQWISTIPWNMEISQALSTLSNVFRLASHILELKAFQIHFANLTLSSVFHICAGNSRNLEKRFIAVQVTEERLGEMTSHPSHTDQIYQAWRIHNV